MLTLLVKVGTSPQQIDGFPDDCERSCKGALHIRPGTLRVTDGEWKYIQAERSDLASQMVDASPPAASAVRPQLPVAEDEPATATEPEPALATSLSGSKRRSRRSGSFPDAD